MLTEAALLLESLPLTTSEFGLATNRLNNARRYLESNVICVELSNRGIGGDLPCDDILVMCDGMLDAPRRPG